MLLNSTMTPDGRVGRAGGLARGWERFRGWRRARPFVGGLLLFLSGAVIFLSTQLDLGSIKVQMGIEGFQAVLIPIALALLGVLAVLMPAHHVFYGVIALAVAVYSVIGVNLGGFFIGMLLGAIGGVLVVAWAKPGPKRVRPRKAERSRPLDDARPGEDVLAS